jgi:type I restriction-modification system DNA methylase subunit
MDAAEYKQAAVGLIFLKYISAVFKAHHAKPPFNMKSWGSEHLREDKRWKFGLAVLQSLRP